MAEKQTLAQKFKLKTPTNLGFGERIMVIEDQQDLRLIIVHHLNKLNYKNVVHKANGYEAIEFMKDDPTPIKAFISDMDMPVIGGLDFLSELRESVNLQGAPFCLAMDHVSKEKLMLAVEHGVDEILVKPFTFKDINPKLKSAFSKYHTPNNPEKIYELAKSALREGKHDIAEKVYHELCVNAPKAARPIVGKARVFVGREDLDQALKLLDEAEKKNPNFVHLYTERGEIYGAMSKWDEAIKSFEKAISLSPLNAFRYKSAADMLFQVKKYREAADLLSKAVQNELDFPDLYHFLSQANFALKDYKLAAKYIRTALNEDPENVVYLNQLGISLKELDMCGEAQKVYNKIIKIDPGNAPALYNKAILLWAKNDRLDAVKSLERLLKKHPNFEPAIAKLKEFKGGQAA
jgi:tetratricopeptide (TPR) repeat protein